MVKRPQFFFAVFNSNATLFKDIPYDKKSTIEKKYGKKRETRSSKMVLES
jgi:hypothetical protein